MTVLTETSFKILELPTDILTYLARECLTPPTAVALSLTCKALYNLFLPHLHTTGRLPLNNKGAKAELCELLERDVSDEYYFCPICPSLHRYLPSDGPTSSDFALNRKALSCRRCRWTLGDDRFTLGLHHVRLALNRHLYGPSSGIPLENFEVSCLTHTYPSWSERWSAKIVDDDLFLSSTRTLSYGSGYMKLLDGFYASKYKLCEHTLLLDVPAVRPRPPYGMEPCTDVLGHCRQCFTDWAVTIEKPQLTVRGGFKQQLYNFTIVTYHRFPSNRAPAGGADQDSRFDYGTKILPLYRRAGLVRDIWHGCAKRTEKAGRWVRVGVFHAEDGRPNRYGVFDEEDPYMG
ncbi:hypothetical protein VTI74DRAFT_10728 [Chaetomium olivicolor]